MLTIEKIQPDTNSTMRKTRGKDNERIFYFLRTSTTQNGKISIKLKLYEGLEKWLKLNVDTHGVCLARLSKEVL